MKNNKKISQRNMWIKNRYKKSIYFIGIFSMLVLALGFQEALSNTEALVHDAYIKAQSRQSEVLSALKQSPMPEASKEAPSKLVFVSLSMPDLLLQQIFEEANTLQIPVVIRGFYQNSFQETARRVFDLTKEKNTGGILINPLWFRQYHITEVPAVVVAKERGFDVVYGNLPIREALEIITRHKEVGVL